MNKTWSASEIMRASNTYWSGCALQAAVQLDLFTALEAGAQSEEELAARLECNGRAFAMLTTALVAMGLLERTNGKVRATLEVLHLLSRKSEDYLGFIILHHAHIMPGWANLAMSVRAGKTTLERTTLGTDDAVEREAYHGHVQCGPSAGG